MSSVLTWGPTVAPSPPPDLDPADGLQPIVDAMTYGQVYDLGPGVFYADPGNPTTPLVIGNNAYGLVLRGTAQDHTLIGSPILISTGRVGLERLWVRADGCAYGVKIYNGGSPFISRCHLNNMAIGASSKAAAQAGLGPRDGLIIDGAGVFLAEKATMAFSRRHGLVVDSTGVEPNTTLKFDMCSWVQNGFGPAETTGYGIEIQGPCAIAEFNGGNSEGNAYGEMHGQNFNNIRFRDFDFESNESKLSAANAMVHLESVHPIMFDNCEFNLNAGSVTWAIDIQSGSNITIINNRIAGFGTNPCVRIDTASSKCIHYNNEISGASWFEDYSR